MHRHHGAGGNGEILSNLLDYYCGDEVVLNCTPSGIRRMIQIPVTTIDLWYDSQGGKVFFRIDSG